MSDITPTVGRKIWFFPGENDPLRTRQRLDQPLDATISGVNGDGTVSVGIRSFGGDDVGGRGSVRIVDPDLHVQDGKAYATWMPYQREQAAKDANKASERFTRCDGDEPPESNPMRDRTNRPFHIGAQNDALFIISGKAPAINNDYSDHDADRTCVAKVCDEAEARRLVGLAQVAMPGAAPAEPQTFEQALQQLINRYSMESGSDTPDFALASYLSDCLAAYEKAVRFRIKVGESVSAGIVQVTAEPRACIPNRETSPAELAQAVRGAFTRHGMTLQGSSLKPAGLEEAK